MTENEVDVLRKTNKETSFRDWLGRDEIRVLISQIPENDGILPILLKSAYGAGHNAGEGLVLGEMIKAVMKDHK